MITNSQGIQIWLRAFKDSKYGSLTEAAEWMYKLNVLARSLGHHVSHEDRHPIVDQIYTLKDELIKYLYQSGYATEVRESIQNRPCRACGGTGEHWTGAECFRCYGTGVYAQTKLYAFRFCIDGKSYAWHQLQKLVDYPVTLTDAIQEPFRKPRIDDEFLKLEDAWLGVCCVWWALLLHGTVVDLMLFRRARMAITMTILSRRWWKKLGQNTWQWLITWNGEKVMWLLIVLFALAMIFGCIFWHPILYWIWCNVFQRCVDGIAY